MVKLRLVRNSKFNGEVSFNEIHGEFPYKLYAEVIGSNAYGKNIVIVSSSDLRITGDKIVVEFIADASTKYRSTRYSAKVLKPLDVKQQGLELTVYNVDNAN